MAAEKKMLASIGTPSTLFSVAYLASQPPHPTGCHPSGARTSGRVGWSVKLLRQTRIAEGPHSPPNLKPTTQELPRTCLTLGTYAGAFQDLSSRAPAHEGSCTRAQDSVCPELSLPSLRLSTVFLTMGAEPKWRGCLLFSPEIANAPHLR